MIDQTILGSLGFSQNEIEIYQILLEKGEIGIGRIAKKTKITRPNVYNVLYSLTNRGLVGEGNYHGKKTFIAKSPMVLENIFQEKIDLLKSDQVKLQNILPSMLMDFQLTNKTPLIASFKGIEGLKKIYDHVLKVRKPLSIFVSYADRIDPKFSALIDEQIKKQSRLGIKVKSLGYDQEYSKTYWKFAKKHHIDIKIFNQKMILPAQILIYGDNLAYTAFTGDYISTLISNKEIAKTMQIIFNIMWLMSKIPKIVDRPMEKKKKM